MGRAVTGCDPVAHFELEGVWIAQTEGESIDEAEMVLSLVGAANAKHTTSRCSGEEYAPRMQRNNSSTGASPSGARQRYEEKTVRVIRGREQSAIEKAQLEGWEVVRQDTGKLQSTLVLRRPRTTTSVESILDRLPVVGGMSDAHRPVVFIAAALVVLALIITPMAILTSGDTEEAASTPSVPASEPVVAGQPAESSEPVETQVEENSTPPEAYAGPAYEIAETDKDAVLGEQDQVWVYAAALDLESPGLQEDVKLIIEDVAREQGTPNLTVNVVTDREVIEANSMSTALDFNDEHGMEYYENEVAPKEATTWVAIYTGGMDMGAVELSTADSAYVLDWWPGGDHESEIWKPAVAA